MERMTDELATEKATVTKQKEKIETLDEKVRNFDTLQAANESKNEVKLCDSFREIATLNQTITSQ